MYPRNIKTELAEAVKYSPVVLIEGARQTGKSTLSQGLYKAADRPTYVSFDDIPTLALAKSSPKSFVQGLQEKAIVDEVQRAPEIFLPIKETVDNSRKTCRFLLTGSANVLTLPSLSDSLAGRMETITLWPLSQGEIRGKRDVLVDLLFQDKRIPQVKELKQPDLLEMLTIGGYPDVLQRPTPQARIRWFRGYVNSILGRDVRDLSRIEGITELPNLLKAIAARVGGLLNVAELSRSLKIPHMTLKRYLALLQTVFMVVQISPWYNNLNKRLVKSPKLFLNDTGLLCYLLTRNATALETDRSLLGSVFENFVLMELMKQASWSETQPDIYHFRTGDNRYEVNFVLEARDGSVVGIECKASSNVKSDNWKGMRELKALAGKKFHRGVILYTGTNVLNFDDDMVAVPVSALWETATKAAPQLTPIRQS